MAFARVALEYANRGKELEVALATRHTFYRNAGAYIERNPTRYKIIGKTPSGGLTCVPEETSPPDYSAQIDGDAFLFDAKECAGASWPMAALAVHQARAFDVFTRNQGIAGVYLRFTAPPFCDVWLPWLPPPLSDPGLAFLWNRWKDGDAKRGESSLTREDARRVGRPVIGMDWLSVARERR